VEAGWVVAVREVEGREVVGWVAGERAEAGLGVAGREVGG
jgi:hypothetical protein